MSADRIFIFIGAILGFLGVALGAFGAHFLKSRLSPEMLAVFETGVKYHLIHALALLITAWIAAQYPYLLIRLSGWLFFAGVLIFSTSLYLLATTGVNPWAAFTPIS